MASRPSPSEVAGPRRPGGQLRRAAGPRTRRVAAGRSRGPTGSASGRLLSIGLVILAVLIGIRLLGGLFGGGQAATAMVGPAWMVAGPGTAPAMAARLRRRRGGGFMSSMFGGIGGAMAGNWLYDQFSGRITAAATPTASSYTPGRRDPDPGGDDRRRQRRWGGGSGVGGDWGGGDGGGGGDWGGGGGGAAVAVAVAAVMTAASW